MPIPQRLTFVTLGARSVATLREFYKGWGWEEAPDSTDEFAAFVFPGGLRLALYPIELLRDEAAPTAQVPTELWNGITLAINFASPQEVDAAFAEAVARGARTVAQPVEREWGGYTAYVGDPEGQRWELAWAPGLEPEAAGE